MGILDEPLAAAKHQAIWNFTESCSLPVYRATDQEQAPIGTGTLIEVCERRYLVTAAHVAQLGGGSSLGVPTDRSFRAVTTLGACTVLRAAQEEHDVALIALEDEQVVERLKAWRFLQLENLGTPWFTGPFLIFGYLQPDSYAAGSNRPGKAVGLIVGKHDGGVLDTADPLDEQNEMLLEWPPKPITLGGEPVDPPRLQGLSGASVWAMEPEASGDVDLWTPATQLRLVAVQSSAVQGKYIRAKRWHLLWSAFAEVEKNAGYAVRSALEGHRERLEERARKVAPKKKGRQSGERRRDRASKRDPRIKASAPESAADQRSNAKPRVMEARGLLIRQPFADWIVDGRKTWEIRGSASKVRGRIAILAAGTGTVVGTCELCDVEGPLKLKDLRSNARKLNKRASEITGPLYYRDRTYAWVLRGAKRLRKPVPYDHPLGAVIWVSLDARLARRIGL